jgi:hypothetical protein
MKIAVFITLLAVSVHSTAAADGSSCNVCLKDVRNAPTDPDAMFYETEQKIYSYYCDDPEPSILDDLSACGVNVGTCSEPQTDLGSDTDLLNCYADTTKQWTTCSLGNGACVVFRYNEYDLSLSISEEACGVSYSVLNAIYMPDAKTCLDWFYGYGDDGVTDPSVCNVFQTPVLTQSIPFPTLSSIPVPTQAPMR